jgi:hypothetical protein
MSDVPSVVQALSAVMGDVQAVGKSDTNTQQGYKFRGVDAVVNAVGPALRKHGVVVVPIDVAHESEHYQSAKGTQMKAVTVTVKYRFYGPAGDYIDATTCGESADSGDKAIPKAHSVAYRVLLLQSLCIPTDDPDPDTQANERATSEFQPPPSARAAANGSSTISEAQQRRLWAIARTSGVPDDTVKDVVARVAGVESTKDIPKDKYDAVIADLEAPF